MDFVESRINPVKELSKEMNANYYYGLDSVKEKFYFEKTYGDILQSNIIAGTKDGYEYCFVEYYAKNKGNSSDKKRTTSPQWITKVKLKMKDKNFPNIELTTRQSAYLKAFFYFLFSFFMQFGCLPFYSEVYQGRLPTSLIIYFFLFIFGFASLLTFYASIFTLKEIFNQNKYNIRDLDFKNKYVILAHSSDQKIRDIFSDEVCKKIVSFTPEISNIEIIDSCLSDSFDYNEQLSLELCNKYLDKLINQAKLFEKEASSF